MDKSGYIHFLKESLREIKKVHNENYLSVFAGAGVSMGSDLPDWNELIDMIKKRLGGIESKDDNLVIAEKFYIQSGEALYYNKLKEFIPDDTKANHIHEAIVNLNIKNIITTNWDNLFEKAVYDNGRYFDIIKQDKDMCFTKGHAKLIKMHGSLDRENIVFRESDYLDYSKNFPLIENYVKAIFSTDVVILVGYSLGDYNIKQIISWLSGETKPIYFIKTKREFNLLEYEYYKSKNIYMLYLKEWCNEEEHLEQLIEFFQYIKNRDENIPEIKVLPVLLKGEIISIHKMLIEFDNTKMKKEIKKIMIDEKITDTKELKKAFLLYHTQQYFESYEALKRLSREAFKNRNHTIWFLSEFNRKNFIFYLNEANIEENKKINEYLESSKQIDLDEDYMRLPFNVRQQLKPLKDLELCLHKKLIKIYELRDKIEKDYKNYKSGGFSSNNYIGELIDILNEVERQQIGLCVLHDDGFYKNALKAIWIALANAFLARDKHKKAGSQIQNIDMKPKFFAYSIRHFRAKEIINIFNEFYKEEYHFTFGNQEILLNIFDNISSLFNSNHSIYTNHYSRWFNNFLIISARIKLEQDTFEYIINKFCEKLKDNIISINEYETIDDFIYYQYKRENKVDFKKLIDIIVAYMNNINDKRFNGCDITAQTNIHLFKNIFIILKEQKHGLTHKKHSKLIQDFIESIPLVDIIKTFKDFVIGLHSVVDKELQATISSTLREKIENLSDDEIEIIDAPPSNFISDDIAQAYNDTIGSKGSIILLFCKYLVDKQILTQADYDKFEMRYKNLRKDK